MFWVVKDWLKPAYYKLRNFIPENNLEYWNKRAKQYGKRAVLNLAHSEEEYEKFTISQWMTLEKYLKPHILPSDKIALDYGCGPGRFTSLLANLIDGNAVGIDISEDLIKLAPIGNNVSYHSGFIENIKIENKFDLVWICLVLGGIPDNQIKKTIRTIEGLMKSGGGIFLVENTHFRSNAPHWTFRSKEFYRNSFPNINIEYLGGYEDAGEEISIFFGRKK